MNSTGVQVGARGGLGDGALVGATVHPADCADKETLPETLADAEENLRGVCAVDTEKSEDGDTGGHRPAGGAVCKEATDVPRSVVADKGYNKAALLRELKEKGYRTYIPERRQAGRRRWVGQGGSHTATAFHGNRARVKRKKGRGLQRKRGELVERTFAHICETGGARRTRLRGRENVKKRYLLQASAANLGLVMRSLFGRGTPRGLAETQSVCRRAPLRITAAPQAGVNALLRALVRTFQLLRAPRSTADLTRALANAGEVA
jgi:transposase